MRKIRFVKRQRPVHGHARKRRTAYVTRDIERAIERTAVRFGVSKSFVIAVAVAQQLGVESKDTM